MNELTLALIDALEPANGEPVEFDTMAPVYYVGPPSIYYQRGNLYFTAGWPHAGDVYIYTTDTWAKGSDFRLASVGS